MKLIKMKNILLLCGICLAAVSCDLGGDEIQVVPDIEEAFKVDLWENLTTAQRSFTLGFESIEKIPCGEETIYIDLDPDVGGNFTLNINVLDNNCSGELLIAEEVVDIGRLPLGIHDVEINLRDVIVNKGRLNVSEKGYEIILDSHAGLSFENWELMRVPEQSFWGYAGFIDRPTSSEELDIPMTFIERMHTYANEMLPEAGYYSYFKVDSLSNLTILKEAEFQTYEPIMTTYTPFFFTHYDNIDKIKQFTQQYLEALDNPNFQIQIFTSDGEAFLKNTVQKDSGVD